MFTAPLQCNGSYSNVACKFVAAGMFTKSLPSNDSLFWLHYSSFRPSCHNIRSKWYKVVLTIFLKLGHIIDLFSSVSSSS
jgi:hypothetical protein